MRYLAVVLAVLVGSGSQAVCGEALLRWSDLPALPPGAGQTEQIGVAGPFAGVHGGALIVAGGANFPQAAPWKGGAKRLTRNYLNM